MRFVRKWSFASANQISTSMQESHQKRAAYYYGFQIIYGALVKGVILVSLSLLLGIIAPTLLIALVFCSMRLLAGGYHMDTYGKCLLVSTLLFIGAAFISQYTYSYWNMLYMLLLIAGAFSYSLYTVIRYAPKDTPNKPITEPAEIRKFKCLSIGYLLIWLPLALVLAIYEFRMAVLSISFGIILESFTLTPIGHSFFEFVRLGLNKKKKYRSIGSMPQ